MRFLSNLFHHHPPQGPVSLRPSRPEELHACLRLILSSGGGAADEGHIVSFLQNARARKIDLSLLLVAEQAGVVVWCVLPLLFPGRTTMYLAAPVQQEQLMAATAAVRELLRQHEAQGMRLAQVLLDPDDGVGQGFFESCGFLRLAELVYLEAKVKELPASLPAGFELQTYSPQTHEHFARAIAASYEKTLDCPGLEGVRSVEEVIAGHKAAGVFQQRYWFVAMQQDMPVGVLLLNPVPPSDAMELVYIGLAVEARGKGLAEALMKLAFTTAKHAGCHRLTTAVDAQNVPAMRMYLRQGMQRIGSRLAMMRVLSRNTPIHPPLVPNAPVKRG